MKTRNRSTVNTKTGVEHILEIVLNKNAADLAEIYLLIFGHLTSAVVNIAMNFSS
jgi:hypothetical protein